ncbi:MAG TPA: RNA polymerase sigma factor [Galbitalea sp.]|nr:RNA polymerase sigma factor [Galbitalea sp.]
MSVTAAQRVQLNLDEFVAQEYPKVVAAVGLITGDRQGAADAVQDALVGYLSSPPAHTVNNLAAWFTVVASNKVRDQQRRSATERRALEKFAPASEELTVELNVLDVDVRSAVMALPPAQRQVCVLHYLLDQSVETIAEGLGVSAGTIKTQLFRARKTLAARLGKGDDHG